MSEIPRDFHAAIADVAKAAMAFGVMKALQDKAGLAAALGAGPGRSLGDALAGDVESLLEIRPGLVRRAYEAATDDRGSARRG